MILFVDYHDTLVLIGFRFHQSGGLWRRKRQIARVMFVTNSVMETEKQLQGFLTASNKNNTTQLLN